jgi:hypothetical protein
VSDVSPIIASNPLQGLVLFGLFCPDGAARQTGNNFVLTVGNTLPHGFLPDSTPHWSTGLSPRNLVPMIGQLNRVYEVLNRKRPLTLRMIWNLHEQLRIPLESLVKPPESSRAA